MKMPTSYNVNDFEAMEQRYRAQFFNSLSGFKSVCLLGTQNQAGHTNLSIVNSVFHLGSNPPLIGMLIRPDVVERHSLDNLTATGWYTLNHISASYYEQAHQTSAKYPSEVSEFEACGFTTLYHGNCIAPFVAESKVQIGLQVAEINELAINRTILVIGAVRHVSVPPDCITDDGFIDLELAGTITCAGLDSYHTTQRLGRLPYAKVK